MESVKPQGSGLGEYVQFGKWTFQNATDQLKKVTDPEEIRKFKDNCVVFNPTEAEQKDRFRAEFSAAAMDRSPVISDVKQEVYQQAEAAIGKFYDGTLSAEELADTYRGLSDRLMDACKDRGYPMPLWGGMMGPAFQETFYGEFRRMVLDEAVQRNNAEGKQYITGEMNAQRNWKYYNSDYYYQSEEAVSALTETFAAMAEERGWEETVSVPDYRAKGLNLYDNFNSALSNHFDVDDQFVMDPNQAPPKDFRWFYQSGGNSGNTTSVTSLTIEHPDGTTTFVDYTKQGFDSTDPTKGITWAAYKDESGTWRHQTADFTYDFSRDDLKNVAGLLKFTGQSGGAQEAVNRFLKNLQIYPGGYFSRFPQYGNLGMNLRV